MRDSFVFYRSFAEAISCLPDEDRLQLMDGLIEYALNETEPEFDGMAKGMFILIKPQIDANNKRYENGKKGADYGVLGGRPRSENPKETPRKPLENPKQTPNVNVNENVNENENVNASDKADVWLLSRSVLSYLNDKAGTSYKTDDVNSVRLITGLSQKGYTEEQMKTVIDKKVGSWLGDPKVEQYLRPSTLFGPKFEQYLSEPDSARKQKQDKERKKAENREKYQDEIKGIRIQLAVLEKLIDEAEVPEKINLRIRRDALEARLNDLNRITGGPS